MHRTNHVQPSLVPRVTLRHAASPPQAKGPQDAPTAPWRLYLGPLLISAFLSLSGVGLYMWPRVQGVRLAYRLQSAEQRMKDLLQERDHLRLELASLQDPQRVYRVATEQLGMATPKPDQVIVLVRELKR